MTISAFRATFFLVLPVALAQQPSPATDNQSPFLSIPPPVSDSLRFGEKLPEFEARDIGGRTWRTEDMHGKFTVVYIWSTTAARYVDKLSPRAHHDLSGMLGLPDIQRFYDKVRNTANIQVLTFCTDYDYTHAPEYMEQTPYTFPVIADWVLIRKCSRRTNRLPVAGAWRHSCGSSILREKYPTHFAPGA